MRDPLRIPEMIVLLAETWMRNPDLRLGQLIVILRDQAIRDRQEQHYRPQTFYIEDDVMLEALRKRRKEGR